MRIDLQTPDEWSALNDRCRTALGLDDTIQVQAYAGYQHALLEVTQGLAKLFSVKKTVGFNFQTEMAAESVAVPFSQEGYTVRSFTQSDLINKATFENAGDLLFVAFSEDDPITGALYDATAVHAALKDKRIFRICVSHAAFRGRTIAKPDLYEIHILSFSPDLAVVVAGDRFRSTPPLAPLLSWRNMVPKAPMANVFSRDVIEGFEASLPSGFQAYFPKGAERVLDRAVVFHSAYDGSAVIDELAISMKRPLSANGFESSLESTSSCRWESPRFAEWLLKRGEKEDVIRGLVIASADLIGEGLALHLEKAAAKIKALQNG